MKSFNLRKQCEAGFKEVRALLEEIRASMKAREQRETATVANQKSGQTDTEPPLGGAVPPVGATVPPGVAPAPEAEASLEGESSPAEVPPPPEAPLLPESAKDSPSPAPSATPGDAEKKRQEELLAEAEGQLRRLERTVEGMESPFVEVCAHKVATQARTILLFPMAPILGLFALLGVKGCDLVEKAKTQLDEAQTKLREAQTETKQTDAAREAATARLEALQVKRDDFNEKMATGLAESRQLSAQAKKELTELTAERGKLNNQLLDNIDASSSRASQVLREDIVQVVTDALNAAKVPAAAVAKVADLTQQGARVQPSSEEYGWFLAAFSTDPVTKELSGWNVVRGTDTPKKFIEGDRIKVLATMNVRSAPPVQKENGTEFPRIIDGLRKGNEVVVADQAYVPRPDGVAQVWVKFKLQKK